MECAARPKSSDTTANVPVELYFPEIDITPQDRRAILIGQLLPFFTSEAGHLLLQKGRHILHNFVVNLDFDVLCQQADSADLLAAVEIQPEEGLKCIEAAAHAALLGSKSQVHRNWVSTAGTEGRVTVHLYNFKQSVTSLDNLKSSSIGKLVTISGSVVRCGCISPQVTSLGFSCPRCATPKRQELQDGLYAAPTSCSEGCKAKVLMPERASAALIDWQKVRIQQQGSGGSAAEGRCAKTVDVELTQDLVESCGVGDEVTVLGLVKVASSEAKKGMKLTERCLYVLYLEAISLQVTKSKQPKPSTSPACSHQQLRREARSRQTDFSRQEVQAFEAFSAECNGTQLRHLVHAFCPSIFGNELVKAGLLLALFGGTQQPQGKRARSNVHVLMCGDPGLGKSQLLQAATAMAPHAVYICGSTSSSAGLTASVVRDSASGGYVCEAGALALADQGACCIDEFDKISAEHQALLGAMEQQEVTTAKAGICARLPARTSVLAAANPAGSQFDSSKSVAENLRMSPAMLARFDLVFLLMDKPDQTWDQRFSEHVLAAHKGQPHTFHVAKKQLINFSSQSQSWASQPPAGPRLKEWLQAGTEDLEVVPSRFLQKYIAYARTRVHPVLSDDAKQILKAFYLELRDPSSGAGSTTTIRLLESLMRLTEARARADLRPEATEYDAQQVVDLMRHTILNERLGSTFEVMKSKRGSSKRAEAQRLLEGLSQQALSEDCSTFKVSAIFDLADQLEINVPDLTSLIEDLNNSGDLLKKGNQTYSLQCGGRSVKHRRD